MSVGQTGTTDRIEKRILLRAPMERVWRALSDADEFGDWFGLKLDGALAPGARLFGAMVGTVADEEVKRAQLKHKHKKFEIVIERMEPGRLFSFRWHPHPMDATRDYASEPMTLVEFALEQQSDGVMLTLTESGFDQIPTERRAAAFSANDGGWSVMTQVLGKYLAGATNS